MKEKPQVLLIDDNPADALLVEEALAGGKYESQMRNASDGEEGMAYLRRRERWAQAPRPDLILLDLNLPKKDGREVLAELKADPDLSRIPVIIFSTSEAPQDIARCYELGANCYVSKPLELHRFFSTVRDIVEFWYGCASLPQSDSLRKGD